MESAVRRIPCWATDQRRERAAVDHNEVLLIAKILRQRSQDGLRAPLIGPDLVKGTAIEASSEELHPIIQAVPRRLGVAVAQNSCGMTPFMVLWLSQRIRASQSQRITGKL